MSNRLLTLAAQIKQLHIESTRLAEASVARAIEAGEYLIEAKQELKHGAWLPWLQEHCGMSQRTAQLYMRLAKYKVQIQKRNVAHLSIQGVVRALEKPKRNSEPLGATSAAPHKVLLAPSSWRSEISAHYEWVSDIVRKYNGKSACLKAPLAKSKGGEEETTQAEPLALRWPRPLCIEAEERMTGIFAPLVQRPRPKPPKPQQRRRS